jgi:hypothetical protein
VPDSDADYPAEIQEGKMNAELTVRPRVTRTTRCKEGFYLLVNGERLWFKTKAIAMDALVSLLKMQRFQVVSVREYQRRKK